MTARFPLSVAMVCMMLASFQVGSASAMTTAPIQHVIIITQENHSFDNYFGTYPTANGTLLDITSSQLKRVNGLPRNVCLPYKDSCISPQPSTGKDRSNPVEGQLTYEMDYANGGTGFATYSGPQSMQYFDYHSIAGYWDYAEEYGLGENYYAPVLSTTTPNRLTLLAGDTPVSANYGPPPRVAYAATLMQQLDDAGVSWGYYDHLDAFGGASNVYPLNYTSNMPLQAFGNIRDISDLLRELVSNSGLPSVSFVNLLGFPEFTEHPPFNPTAGEMRIVSIVNCIMESSYWPSTAIFITWDEGGGFYDHVIPPKEFTIDHGFSDPLLGLGQRVPLLVISPFSKENFVSRSLMSHLSLLHFVEYNWNLQSLNKLVDESTLPLDFFDFFQVPRSPITLVSPVVYPIPLQAERSSSLPNSPIQYDGLLVLVTVPLIFVLLFSMRRFSASRDRRELKQQRLWHSLQPLARPERSWGDRWVERIL